MTTQVQVLGRPVDARWLSTGGRLTVGAVFIFSGFAKVIDIDGTIRTVRAYRLLPEAVVPTFGSALPVVELCLAVLLLTGLMTRMAAIITIPCCTAFFVGVASAWARGLRIECGCFGNNGAAAHPVPGYVRELVLNAVLIAICGWLIRHPASRFSLDSALGLQFEDDEAEDDDSSASASGPAGPGAGTARRTEGSGSSRRTAGKGTAAKGGRNPVAAGALKQTSGKRK